jgi:GT2 family glycosyltransferase
MISVTIIIPAYNEQKHIAKCLHSLLQQTVTCEIIVVDDGSTDRTVEIARSFPAVKLLRQQHQGPGNARNLGARHATGEMLVFCDADQEFDSRYVENLVAPILAGTAVGTYSREEFIANYDNIWARCYNIDAEIYTNKRHPTDIPMESPVFRAIPRALFLRVGGYEDVGYGEDHTISEKARILAQPAPNAVCYHHNPDTLSEVFGQACWYGKGQQVGKGWKMMLWCMPPVAMVGSLRRAVRTRTLAFVIYTVVYRLGVLAGIISWHLSGGRHTR